MPRRCSAAAFLVYSAHGQGGEDLNPECFEAAGRPKDIRRVEDGGHQAVGGGTAAVDLYWLPLGAGGRCVRLNGRVFEAVVSRLERRPACDLYHSALIVRLPEGRFVVEQAPAWQSDAERGVVAEGPVGTRWAGRFRLFRWELRCWPGGAIPDADEAVDSPQRLTTDVAIARLIVELTRSAPVAVWGRDELGGGEMWNSNSVISWLIARSGLPADRLRPPANGRAPGWQAGIVVARRQEPSGREGSDAGRQRSSEGGMVMTVGTADARRTRGGERR